MFVPAWRKESSKPDSPTTAQHILAELERERYAATRDWRFDSDTNPDPTSILMSNRVRILLYI